MLKLSKEDETWNYPLNISDLFEELRENGDLDDEFEDEFDEFFDEVNYLYYDEDSEDAAERENRILH